MQIKGPSDGAPPAVVGVEETQEAAAPVAASPVEPGGAVGEVASATAVTQGNVISYIAQQLRSGAMSPREAVEMLIDDAVNHQVGKITSDHATVASELKELLRHMTETDPYLASRVRRLGNRH